MAAEIELDAGLSGIRVLNESSRGFVRHCKIIGTLGPSSSNDACLRQLISAGMNIARLNFSHGTHSDHLKNIEAVRRISKELGRPVGILQDLQGPKIRVGHYGYRERN